jgi:hypothetical protein
VIGALTFAAWVVLASADDEPSDRRSAQEIVVFGDRLIDPERQALERQLVQQGFDRVIEKNGYVIFRHDDNWKGEFRVYDDGFVRYKRQPVQFRPNRDTALGWASCVLVFTCMKTSGQTISQRKFKGVRRREVEEADPLIRTWTDRVGDRHVGRLVDGLPRQLERLWDEGIQLDPREPPLATPQERKQALLAYWESRTDTLWGDRVRAAVEIFIRAEVQPSPWPFTRAEVDAFNARRTCRAVLDLERPLEGLLEQLEATD